MKLDKDDQRALALWAADCAERVLTYFETKYPQDERPRKAIAAAQAWVRGEIAMQDARAATFAAHAAARAADDPAARAAARAAGHAAATAHVATHAPAAAKYAVKAATAASRDATDERNWQYQHLPSHLRVSVFPDHDGSTV